jgi:hypothetical protein
MDDKLFQEQVRQDTLKTLTEFLSTSTGFDPEAQQVVWYQPQSDKYLVEIRNKEGQVLESVTVPFREFIDWCRDRIEENQKIIDGGM